MVKRVASTRCGASRTAAQLREEVALGVRRAIAWTVLYNDQVASRVGMSASESQSMHLLQLFGPMTPGRLAEVTGLSTGTITGVLDRLERLGFVRRERSTQDRRKVLVSLDEKALEEQMAPYYARARGEPGRRAAPLRPRRAAGACGLRGSPGTRGPAAAAGAGRRRLTRALPAPVPLARQGT